MSDQELYSGTIRLHILHHASREPVFGLGLIDEMGEKFEEIEHEVFGEDGFDGAVEQIGEIEAALGLTDLAQFTAPQPPPVK